MGQKIKLLGFFRGEEGIVCEVRTGREMFSTSEMPKISHKIREHVMEGTYNPSRSGNLPYSILSLDSTMNNRCEK